MHSGLYRAAVFSLLAVCVASMVPAAIASEPVLHRPPDRDALAEPGPPLRDAPTGEEIVNPAEFCRADGLFLAWSGWGQSLIADIALAIAEDDNVYMMVRNTGNQATAENDLTAYGVNMDNVHFIIDPAISNTSMWIRDYGPFCIYEDGREAIVDFFYGVYPGDDGVPETIAEYFGLPYYESNLLHHGGNHIIDGSGMAICSDNMYEYNPGWTEEQCRQEMKSYLGVDSLVVIEPMAGDGTGHIDMFCKLLNDTLLVVGEYESPDDSFPGDYEHLNNLAAHLDTLRNLDGREFEVVRIPQPPFTYGGPAGTINYTYTNSQILNDKVLVPIYGFESDAEALQLYADLMPGYEIIGIDSSFIIQYWGAIHCVANTLHGENPLVVLHEPLTSVPSGSPVTVAFRINPRFTDTTAAVYYRQTGELEFTEATAEFADGVWTAILPPVSEDFAYYLAGHAVSGDSDYLVTLPDDAPAITFDVTVGQSTAVPGSLTARAVLSSYPNPFNPQTTISFSLERDQWAEIGVYELTGKRVTVLTDRVYDAGRHSLTWNGRDSQGRAMPSGTYFVRLVTESGVEARKVMLVR